MGCPIFLNTFFNISLLINTCRITDTWPKLVVDAALQFIMLDNVHLSIKERVPIKARE
jgi:hypothetical protein